MQETTVKNIIKNIDKIISNSLQISYNKNVSKSSFSTADILRQDQSGIHFSDNDIEIIIHSQESLIPVSKIDYRIPQTRVYITFLQNEDYFIKVIKYFNFTIVIAEYFNKNSSQIIELHSKKSTFILQYPENQKVNDNSIKLSKSNINVAQISDKSYVDLIKLPDFINDCIDDEIKSHPISRIQSNNLEFLKELDQKWVLIQAIKRNNEIDVNTLMTSDLSNLLWIQEIYLQLGWIDQLEKFYDEISKIELSSQNIKIVATALYRYNLVCELLDRGFLKVELNRSISSKDINGKFLQCFLTNPDQLNFDIYESIQHAWNYFHIPVVRLKFQRLIQENPDEYIAFALLALQYRFWWYEMLVDILLTYLSEDKKVIYNFLSILNKFNNLRFNCDSICFSKYDSGSSNLNSKIRFIDSINKKDTIKNRELYSCLEKDSSFFIRINKTVEFEYFINKKQIKLRPHSLYRFSKNYSECVITISDFSMYVPLIWDQFTVEFNKCRFKFLRKKDRFQVTIKFAQSVSKIKMNNDQVINNSGPVIKHYLPINKVKSTIYLSAYNVYGARLKNNFLNSDMAILIGIGYNAFGIMNSQFRVYSNGQKKSSHINLNTKNSYFFNLNRTNLKLTLTASKFDPENLKLNYGDPFIIKLLNTNSHELFYKLKIFVDSSTKKLTEVINVFNENLGFIPIIENLSALIPNKNHLICIISDTYRNQSFDKGIEYKVIPINEKAKQTALWLNPDYIQNLFSEAFFTSFFV